MIDLCLEVIIGVIIVILIFELDFFKFDNFYASLKIERIFNFFLILSFSLFFLSLIYNFLILKLYLML